MEKDFTTCCSVRGFCAKGCGRQDKQLNTYDYLAGIPGNENAGDLVEVQFKHTRKGYYRNDNHLPLEKGDMVAVEASPGHDIGVVTLTGQLVPLQMKKANLKPGVEIKRIYRKARPADLEKYEESKALEQDTMIRSRKIAQDLNLNMKIGDVEYQGDGNKAIFYYIADARVDFRQLIKVLAEAFHVRIEMKQIGARQEAGRIGGIGPCGRELCCATWMKNFNSVSTTAARFQDISPNPQKLAGQCAKLKCCLNYEVDTYVEASKKIPPRDLVLETADATYFLFKADILAGMLTYSTDKRMAANLVTISTDRAQTIIQMNKAGEKPAALDETLLTEPERPVDLVEQEDLHRFDKSKRRGKNNKRKGNDGKKDTRNAESSNATSTQREGLANGNNQNGVDRERKNSKEQVQPKNNKPNAGTLQQDGENSVNGVSKDNERRGSANRPGTNKNNKVPAQGGKMQKGNNRQSNANSVAKERPMPDNKNTEKNTTDRPSRGSSVPKEGRPLLENKKNGGNRPQESNRPSAGNTEPRPRKFADGQSKSGEKQQGTSRFPKNNSVPKEGRPLLENKNPILPKLTADHRQQQGESSNSSRPRAPKSDNVTHRDDRSSETNNREKHSSSAPVANQPLDVKKTSSENKTQNEAKPQDA